MRLPLCRRDPHHRARRHYRAATGRSFGALDNRTRGLIQELLLGIWEREQKTVPFVTHDIEEAISLASRVVVMSARPGQVKVDLPVELPHPRPFTVTTSPAFSALKVRLTEEIRTEALRAASEQ